MITLACWTHRLHEVEEKNVARIVAALTAALFDQESDPIQAAEPVRTCPLEALSWSNDQEVYAEDVDALFEGVGLDIYQ